MSRTFDHLTFVHGFIAATLLAGAVSSASAASISYPDLGPVAPGVTFVDIAESSGTDAVPLYGAPSALGTGLAFSPTPAFASSSTGGSADLTDGQLNYTMIAGTGSGGIPLITYNESGVYTLSGVGAGTQASVGAVLRATVTEVNGTSVSPIALAIAQQSLIFSLPADVGSAAWSLGLSVDVASELAGHGYGSGDVATRIDVTIDNVLGTTSTVDSTASISKTNLTVLTTPEPASILLGVFAAGGLALCRVRRGVS
ncbi:MAG: hypothetical protein CMJ58_07130 [Planctomycetaceae bacterium]|nr:hypothetical protein [Planctomycetaceae bacterium]